MKAPSTSFLRRGFSTIELLIALALLSVIMTATVGAIASSQYWFITSKVSAEAMTLSKKVIDDTQQKSRQHFHSVLSIAPALLFGLSSSSDTECLAGGLCYFVQTEVVDVSSCAKEVSSSVLWQLGKRYATSSILQTLYLSNPSEIIAQYGDCQVVALPGDWFGSSPVTGSVTSLPAQGNTGIDVLGKYLYVTSVTSPYLRIFEIDASGVSAPVLVGSTTGAGLRLNDIDVIRDFKTGRLFAYVTKHSTTSQLAVFDVTDEQNPQLLIELSLFGVASGGSFPQGWRVVAYGEQLFVVSRETTGPELHIFSITNPELPVEITTSALNLNRTVNDMTVRDEIVAGVKRRFLYLAASSDLKELGVYDVTNSPPVEVAAINLAGSADAISIYLNGGVVYLGRRSNTSSELYAVSSQKLIVNDLEVLGVSEVGADVLSLGGTAQALLIGTSKIGAEFQVWDSDTRIWSQTVVNAGRKSFVSSSKLAPLGFDVSIHNVYAVSESLTLPETISVISTP
jgi:prepilin-type N-terminal cleavage/methylation domain-containing protein